MRGIAISVGVIAGSLLLALLVHRVLSFVVARVSSRTGSDLDDIIVESLNRPFMLALLALGLYVGVAGALSASSYRRPNCRNIELLFAFLL